MKDKDKFKFKNDKLFYKNIEVIGDNQAPNGFSDDCKNKIQVPIKVIELALNDTSRI